MRGKDLLNSISDVDNDLIAEAESSMNMNKKKPMWQRWIVTAAGFFLVATAGIGAWQMGVFDTKKNGTTDKNSYECESFQDELAANGNGNQNSIDEVSQPVYTDSVNLPENIENDAQADMIGCLVYKGKVYTQAESYNSREADFEQVKKLLGDYVGTAKGTLDEWSLQSDFATELASTYCGSVYKVAGYSEDFRLCIKGEYEGEEWMDFLENYDGIGLSSSADLFEERLHLSGNIESAACVNDEDGSKETTSIDLKRLEDFLEELYKSPLVKTDYNAGDRFCNIVLNMKDGTRVTLVLMDGGYVGCTQLRNVYVKMSKEAIKMLLLEAQ